MKHNLVLVNPPITLEERYGSFASVGSQAPPLGLCYLASSAKKQGYAVRIIDAPALSLDLACTLAAIAEAGAEAIGITASTVSFNRAIELAKAIRQAGMNCPLIVGGSHVSSLPRETMEECPEFDMGVINEGEYTICDILAALKSGGGVGDIRGIVYRNGNEILLTPHRDNITDLDALPFPAWELLPNLAKHYKPSPHSYRRLPS